MAARARADGAPVRLPGKPQPQRQQPLQKSLQKPLKMPLKMPLQASLQLSLQFADASHRAQLPRHRVQRWLRAALAGPAQITVRIVGQAEGLALNRDFRGQDHATNVLTFGYERAPVVAAEALALGLPMQHHYAHLLVHGALHAQGMDHIEEGPALAMESRESALLLGLGFADPYGR